VKRHVKAKATNKPFTGLDRGRCISARILHLFVTRRDSIMKVCLSNCTVDTEILKSVRKITDASFADHRFTGFNQS
jgi:hypothetical protein